MTGPQSTRPPTLPPTDPSASPPPPFLSLSFARSSLPCERPDPLRSPLPSSCHLSRYASLCAFAPRRKHGDGSSRRRERIEQKGEKERAGGVDSDSETTYLTYNLACGTSNSFFAPRSELPTWQARMKRSLFGTECPARVSVSSLRPCTLPTRLPEDLRDDGAALSLPYSGREYVAERVSARGKIFRGGQRRVCSPWKSTLVLIGNVTGRNAHIASAGGVYAGSHYLKCTAAVSHTGPPAGKNKTPKCDTTRARARVSTRVAC